MKASRSLSGRRPATRLESGPLTGVRSFSASPLRTAFRAHAVDDAAITDTIRAAPRRHGIVPCPHAATGLHVLEGLRAAGDRRPWAVAATAHPAKFDGIVEPLVGHAVQPPPALAESLSRPAQGEDLPADYEALRDRLLA